MIEFPRVVGAELHVTEMGETKSCGTARKFLLEITLEDGRNEKFAASSFSKSIGKPRPDRTLQELFKLVTRWLDGEVCKEFDDSDHRCGLDKDHDGPCKEGDWPGARELLREDAA